MDIKEIRVLRLPASLGEDVMQRYSPKTISDREVCLLANQDDLLLKAVINATNIPID